MKLDVYRYSDNGESTLGLLFIDGKFSVYTLEDEHRDVKVMGETRIPEGEYKIELRTFGGHHKKFSHKFSSFHKGMLWIKDVPGFEHILIHYGNTDDSTAGCLLVGNSTNNNNIEDGFIGSSINAYKTMYQKVIKAIDEGEEVTISYYDNIC